jgi:hypothetical protein
VEALAEIWGECGVDRWSVALAEFGVWRKKVEGGVAEFGLGRCQNVRITCLPQGSSRVRFSVQPPSLSNSYGKQYPTLNLNNFAIGNIGFFLDLSATHRKVKKTCSRTVRTESQEYQE